MNGNRELVGQALANLVDNALKYAGARNPRRRAMAAVNLGARQWRRRPDRYGRATTGRAYRRRSRARARALRAPRSSRTRPGSGLGLSLANAVMRLHGGVEARGQPSGFARYIVFPPPSRARRREKRQRHAARPEALPQALIARIAAAPRSRPGRRKDVAGQVDRRRRGRSSAGGLASLLKPAPKALAAHHRDRFDNSPYLISIARSPHASLRLLHTIPRPARRACLGDTPGGLRAAAPRMTRRYAALRHERVSGASRRPCRYRRHQGAR